MKAEDGRITEPDRVLLNELAWKQADMALQLRRIEDEVREVASIAGRLQSLEEKLKTWTGLALAGQAVVIVAALAALKYYG